MKCECGSEDFEAAGTWTVVRPFKELDAAVDGRGRVNVEAAVLDAESYSVLEEKLENIRCANCGREVDRKVKAEIKRRMVSG